MIKAVYLILLSALVGWKGWHAWKRGCRQWAKDMQQYQTLWEYLLANGATLSEARKPFLKRAVQRAFKPMLRQWQLWAIVAAIGLLVFLVN